jgi:adenylate cyclase
MTNVPHKEIERRFLPPKAPDGVEGFSRNRIAQGYIADRPNIVRLRSLDDCNFLLTVKHGHNPVHDESEIHLTRWQFYALWPFTEGRRLHKMRYQVPCGKHTVDLDVFEGVHAGLIIAEVEFTSENDCLAFNPPDWFGVEITGDPHFSNRHLAVE